MRKGASSGSSHKLDSVFFSWRNEICGEEKRKRVDNREIKIKESKLKVIRNSYIEIDEGKSIRPSMID